MNEEQGKQKALKGKILIKATLQIITGIHIGGSSDFSSIGEVDSPFIRDFLTKQPIIPGSSVKGKLRTLLAKNTCKNYVLQEIEKDDAVIKRLFGYSGKDLSMPARLQFFDLFMKAESVDSFSNMNSDTYLGEVKFENTISRLTGTATPRQIERVPAGAEFDFLLVYNVENDDQVDEDMQILTAGIRLLQTDYLGGHGSRGYGRVKLREFHLQTIGKYKADCEKYAKMFEESGSVWNTTSLN